MTRELKGTPPRWCDARGGPEIIDVDDKLPWEQKRGLLGRIACAMGLHGPLVYVVPEHPDRHGGHFCKRCGYEDIAAW